MNWYTTRESFKGALESSGPDRDALIDKHIAGATKTIDKQLNLRFVPETKTRFYPWPQRTQDSKQILWLDALLLSVDTLKTQNGTVTIAADDYFLEPVNTGPPYRSIEIDLGDNVASDAEFGSDDSSQRAISVLGSWAFGNDTEPAGTVASGLASGATVTTFVCSDGSLIDVGDTLLMGSEQVFVSGRVNAALGSILIDGALTAEQSEVTVTVDGSHGIVAGEIILIGSERMLVRDVSGNDLTVERAYDGSVLAAHSDDTAVHVYRTLTIVRGVNGTTAATHPDTTVITKYKPPEDIQNLCRAEAIFNYEQDKSGHTGVVGGIDGGVGVRPRILANMWERAIANYREWVVV